MKAKRRRDGLDDALLCGAVLLTLGSIALDEQDIARAEGLHLEALEFARRRDNRRLMARVLCNLAEISLVSRGIWKRQDSGARRR